MNRKLDDLDKKILADIEDIFSNFEASRFIVGAGARLLIFDRPYNIKGPSTADWDIAIQVQDWSNYEMFRDRLTQEDTRFQATSVPHRFIHRETRVAIDIIPFGKIGEPDFQIEWPDGNIMNVAGFNEALLNATVV